MEIKSVLKRYGLNGKQLADKMGWSPQRLYSRLKSPSLETLELIAAAIPCEVHELIEPSANFAHFYDHETGEYLGIRRKH